MRSYSKIHLHNSIHDMCSDNNIAELQKLLSQENYIIDSLNQDGYAPLHIAAYKGFCQIVEFLLNAGADINIRSLSGITPIHCAAQRDFLPIVTLLIDQCAKIDLVDHDRRSALYYAVASRSYEARPFLIFLGADTSFLNQFQNHQHITEYQNKIALISEQHGLAEDSAKYQIIERARFLVASTSGKNPCNISLNSSLIGPFIKLLKDDLNDRFNKLSPKEMNHLLDALSASYKENPAYLRNLDIEDFGKYVRTLAGSLDIESIMPIITYITDEALDDSMNESKLNTHQILPRRIKPNTHQHNPCCAIS